MSEPQTLAELVREAIDHMGAWEYDDLRNWRQRAEAALVVETPTDAEDAAKWRALRNCARMTAMGSAGLGPEKAADDYAHVTLNFWTGGNYDSPGEVFARHWLDAFVEKALRAAVKTPAGTTKKP